jgi:hypothetical protein
MAKDKNSIVLPVLQYCIYNGNGGYKGYNDCRTRGQQQMIWLNMNNSMENYKPEADTVMLRLSLKLAGR